MRKLHIKHRDESFFIFGRKIYRRPITIFFFRIFFPNHISISVPDLLSSSSLHYLLNYLSQNEVHDPYRLLDIGKDLPQNLVYEPMMKYIVSQPSVEKIEYLDPALQKEVYLRIALHFCPPNLIDHLGLPDPSGLPDQEEQGTDGFFLEWVKFRQGVKEIKMGKFSYEMTYYESGLPRSLISYQDQDQDGYSLTWYPGGKLHHRFYFEKDERAGLQLTYYPSGQLEKRENFLKGNLHGCQETWYSTGQICSRTRYDEGFIHGEKVTWFPNGKQKSLENYVNDHLTGSAIYWTEEGKKEFINHPPPPMRN